MSISSTSSFASLEALLSSHRYQENLLEVSLDGLMIESEKGLDQLLDVKLDFSEWEEELAMMDTTEEDDNVEKVHNPEILRITRDFIANRPVREAAKAVVKAEQEAAAKKAAEAVFAEAVVAPVVAASIRSRTTIPAARPRTTIRTTIPAATRPKVIEPVEPAVKPKVNMATRVPLGPRPRTTTPVESVVVEAAKPKVNMSTRVPLGPRPRTTTPTSGMKATAVEPVVTAKVRAPLAPPPRAARPSTSALPAVRPRTTTPTSGTRVVTPVEPVIAAVKPKVNMATRVPLGPAPKKTPVTRETRQSCAPISNPKTSIPPATATRAPLKNAVAPAQAKVEPAPLAPKKETVNMKNRTSLAPTRGKRVIPLPAGAVIVGA